MLCVVVTGFKEGRGCRHSLLSFRRNIWFVSVQDLRLSVLIEFINLSVICTLLASTYITSQPSYSITYFITSDDNP